MANLVSMVSNVFECLENFHIDPLRCIKARSPLSKCSACIDTCPVQGIRWTGKNVEINDCIQCGLCASICPTGGIVYKKISPLKVFKEVEKLLKNFNEVFIYCSRNFPEKSLEQGIEVPCLGFFTWESWLSLGLNNKVKIYHSFDKCENCQVKGGKDILKAELQKIEALNDKKLKFLSSLKENNNNGGELEKLQYDKEKRQFLGSIFKSFAKIPETIVTTVIGFETEREGENINSSDEKLSERKELLLKSIAIDPNLKEKIMISLPHIKEGCQFCKVCSILCPQKALIQQEEGNGCKITLDKKLCNGCQLCVDVCYHKAIELKLSNIKELDGAVFVLAEGYEFICSECGMPYKSSVEDKCVNCK